MNTYSPEDLAAAKLAAHKRNGRNEVLLLDLGLPINFVGLFAPLTMASYALAIDAINGDPLTGQANTVVEQLLWPDLDTYLEARGRFPAIPGKVCKALLRRAGREEPDPIVEPLAELVRRKTTAAGVADPLPGLTAARAAELIQAAADKDEGDLWAATSPLLCVVLAQPDPDLWIAAEAAEARAVKSGLVMARLEYAQQAVVWSHKPLDEIFADTPAAATDLWTAYRAVGGAGAQASCKSL